MHPRAGRFADRERRADRLAEDVVIARLHRTRTRGPRHQEVVDRVGRDLRAPLARLNRETVSSRSPIREVAASLDAGHATMATSVVLTGKQMLPTQSPHTTTKAPSSPMPTSVEPTNPEYDPHRRDGIGHSVPGGVEPACEALVPSLSRRPQSPRSTWRGRADCRVEADGERVTERSAVAVEASRDDQLPEFHATTKLPDRSHAIRAADDAAEVLIGKLSPAACRRLRSGDRRSRRSRRSTPRLIGPRRHGRPTKRLGCPW